MDCNFILPKYLIKKKNKTKTTTLSSKSLSQYLNRFRLLLETVVGNQAYRSLHTIYSLFTVMYRCACIQNNDYLIILVSDTQIVAFLLYCYCSRKRSWGRGRLFERGACLLLWPGELLFVKMRYENLHSGQNAT